jgi:aspartate aminotransferase
MGRAVEESVTLRQAARVRELRARGQDICNLTVGEPDCPTPQPILDAAAQAMRDGHTHYTASGGMPELRSQLALTYSGRLGMDWSAAETMVSNGAKQVLWNALAAVVEPGDEVILLSPCWTSYPAYVKLLGGVPRIVEATAENGFRVRPEDLAAALGPRTRALLFNSPVNPTGVVYSAEELRALFEPVLHHDCLVVSDEIYENLVFDTQHVSPLQVHPELRDRFVLATGASKSYAMTGWRMGFALGPAELIQAMIRLQSHMTGNPNTIAQYATMAALHMPPEEVQRLCQRFKHRRDVGVEVLSTLPELRYPVPEGAFYFFLDVGPFLGRWHGGRDLQTSEELAEYLLEAHSVATVPGSAFDHPTGLRLSTTLPESELREGLGTLVQALRERR